MTSMNYEVHKKDNNENDDYSENIIKKDKIIIKNYLNFSLNELIKYTEQNKKKIDNKNNIDDMKITVKVP